MPSARVPNSVFPYSVQRHRDCATFHIEIIRCHTTPILLKASMGLKLRLKEVGIANWFVNKCHVMVEFDAFKGRLTPFLEFQLPGAPKVSLALQ